MTKALALVVAVALSGSAVASEEEAIQLKVYVDGMSCPTGCAPKVAKGLSTVEGAKDVKLADFEKGLFTMSIDAKSGLKPDALKKSLGDYKAKKIEVTVTGTITPKDKEFVLTSATGAKYGLSVAACDAAGKKGDAEGCPEAAAALKAKVETLAKDSRTVKVTGVLGSCCDISLAISAIDEVKKATN